jgi:hypothetical protein
MAVLSEFATPGVLVLLTLASGLWLSRSGKPLNTAIFTIHKLIALGGVIVTALQLYRAVQAGGATASMIALVLLAGACVVALFASGALMSMERPGYATLLRVHNIAPVVAAMAMAGALWLLARGQP